MFILDDLLLAPIKGLFFVARNIHEAVEKELYDDNTIKRELLELQMRREVGQIPDEEFASRQAELFARLRQVKQRQLMEMQRAHTSDSSSLVVEQHPLRDGKEQK